MIGGHVLPFLITASTDATSLRFLFLPPSQHHTSTFWPSCHPPYVSGGYAHQTVDTEKDTVEESPLSWLEVGWHKMASSAARGRENLMAGNTSLARAVQGFSVVPAPVRSDETLPSRRY